MIVFVTALGAGGCRGSASASLNDAVFTGGSPSDANPFPALDGGGAGYALNFDGIRDYATAADGGFPAASAAQTVEMWIKYASVLPTYEDLYVAREDFGGGIHLGFHSGQLAVWRVYVDQLLVKAPSLPSANTWHHVAYTFDGWSTHTLYVDGVAVDSETTTGDKRTPTSVWLGTQDGSRNLFTGMMDEVRVWTVPRTASQIASDRSHTPPGAVDGLVAYWTFDDVGSGGTALDASGNGNTITLGDGVAGAMPSRVVSDAPVGP